VNETIKNFLKDIIPPIIVRALRVRQSHSIWFEGPCASWEEASVKCSGYDAPDILKKVLDATLKVNRGEAAYERDSVPFDEVEYTWPVLAGLMGGAARNGGALNVLDFGGALGSSYFQHRKFLETLPEVRWNIVEQPHYVGAGKTHVEDKHLRFYSTIDACLAVNQPNVVLLSSVLQYLPDIIDLVTQIKQIAAPILILDRTIVNDSGEDRIYIQHVPSTIYQATYPCRSLSQAKLISRFADIYQLEATFQSLDFPVLARINSNFKGFIFGTLQ
jgi:putative methyltransferase (TIGR04325 family)